MSTKYNVLYNGEMALYYGLEELNANYEDDFWSILPIEPLKVDRLALPGMSADEDNSPKEFEKAEEKAVKAIQKHSMLIARQEVNSQIDDAYLLLGKARYYSKRFVPALEAFNYVLINYPNASLINETKVWQAKTLVRLKNEEQAIKNIEELLRNESLKSRIIEDANTTMAMAYASLDSTKLVLNYLNKSVLVTDRTSVKTRAMFTNNKKIETKQVLTTNNPEQTSRNLFILGQIYKAENNIDSSNISFDRLLNFKKAPIKYVVRAHLEKAKNIASDEEAEVAIEAIEKLLKDPYNRPYYSELYFGLGDIYIRNNENLALDYYQYSIEESKENRFQLGKTYESIGDIYFDKTDFITAGAYYDSVLQIAKDPDTKRIRRLIRKRNNLEEVIVYESSSQRNDSILRIVNMSETQRNNFFSGYIENLMAADIRRKELEKINEINTGSSFFDSKESKRSAGEGKWYFYNPQTAGFGQQEFRNIWGNRPLEDNWRLSDKMRINVQSENINSQIIVEIDESKKYELSYYLEMIPTDVSEIDSIISIRNQAYYKLGLIYQVQFKERDLAITKLERLLSFNPDESLEIPTKYNLYKIYTEVGDTEKATFYKNDITSNFPNSQYAKIILNPSEISNQDTSKTPEGVYATVFYEYKDEKYESVIENSTDAIAQFQGEQIVPKFELLKAYAIGKKDGLLAFKDALDFVIANYPSTEEGKKAAEVLQTLNTKL